MHRPTAAPDTTTTTPADPGAAPDSTERTITVNGHGTVSVVPDTADLMAGVQAQAATATEALDTVGTKSQALIDTLKGTGIAPDDIQTAGLSLFPTYGNDGQNITGYQASTNVTATISDVTKVGDVVDALKSLVGEQLTLQGVSFSYKDPETVMAAARTAALANAKVRAEQYAEAAGVELGGGPAHRRGERVESRACSASWPAAQPRRPTPRSRWRPGRRTSPPMSTSSTR